MLRALLAARSSLRLTLIRNDKPFTAAHDGQMALDADDLQLIPPDPAVEPTAAGSPPGHHAVVRDRGRAPADCVSAQQELHAS
ncbi:hypothetical protein GCM10009616_00640 [Microlunatus lacustris]